MANKDVEVEIKIPLDENNISNIKGKLDKIGKFIKTIKQKDEYFIPSHRNFMEPKYPFEWISIRERGDKVILNYKHWYPENVENGTHCDEFETLIDNSEQLKKIFLLWILKI